MRLQFLEQDIGRNLKNDIRDEENRQCRIIFGPMDNIQILLEPENRRITDIHPASSLTLRVAIAQTRSSREKHTDPRTPTDT